MVVFSPALTTCSYLDSAPRIRFTVSEIQADFRLIPASRDWFCPTRRGRQGCRSGTLAENGSTWLESIDNQLPGHSHPTSPSGSIKL
jgi:hypothetical protein